jgi:hypothetical protein
VWLSQRTAIISLCNGQWLVLYNREEECLLRGSWIFMYYALYLQSHSTTWLTVITSCPLCPSRGALIRNFTTYSYMRYELENSWQDFCSDTQMYVMTRRLCCYFKVPFEHLSTNWTPQYRHSANFTCGPCCVLLRILYSLIPKNDKTLQKKWINKPSKEDRIL